jgi:Nuclease-related domain/AAA domain
VVSCIPEVPRFVDPTERIVWDQLRSQLRPEDVLVANQRFTDHVKDTEIDLMVVMPRHGVVVVEVKGGSIGHNGTSWTRRQRGGETAFDPVGQARDARYAARQYVEDDPRWRGSSRSRIRWGHAVVFPYADIPEDFSMPDSPRWLVNGKADMGRLGARLRSLLDEQHTHNRAPDAEDANLVLDILRGRGRPQHTVVAEAEERAGTADRLTQEQLSLLQVTRLLKRVEVRGGAGSGKTVMALTHAKQLTHGRHDVKAQRVALICYSRGLASYFRRVTDTWGRKDRPAFVGTFEELGLRWGAQALEEARADGRITADRAGDTLYYEELLPEMMAALAPEVDASLRFDSIIVDEAQDFAEAWWTPVLGGLGDPEEGGLYLYSDHNQRIFQRFGEPPVPMVPLVLDHNLRNTKQIGEVINPLAPNRMRLLGGAGPDVTFVDCPAGSAIDAADAAVEALLDEGWEPGDIALLTVGSRHEIHRERMERDPAAYYESFWDEDDAFYGNVLGCKGLERRAVVLCVNKDEEKDRDKERLYVGLSRATDRLVVCGPGAYIRQVCGGEVAGKLGIPATA